MMKISKKLYVLLCILLAPIIFLLGIIIVGQICLLLPWEVVSPKTPSIGVVYVFFFIILYSLLCLKLWDFLKNYDKK